MKDFSFDLDLDLDFLESLLIIFISVIFFYGKVQRVLYNLTVLVAF